MSTAAELLTCLALPCWLRYYMVGHMGWYWTCRAADQKENLYLPNKGGKDLWIKGYRLFVVCFPRPVLEPELAGALFACLRLDLGFCIRAGLKQALCVCEWSTSIGVCLWSMVSGGGKGLTGSSTRCSFLADLPIVITGGYLLVLCERLV